MILKRNNENHFIFLIRISYFISDLIFQGYKFISIVNNRYLFPINSNLTLKKLSKLKGKRVVAKNLLE